MNGLLALILPSLVLAPTVSRAADGFLQLSAGDAHSCGIHASGQKACWGLDSSGQATPPATSLRQFSSGADFSCGLAFDDEASCWGANGSGQATPPAGDFLEVSAGSAHACGIRPDRGVECWGSGVSGQTSPPVGKAFNALSSGGDHTCGIQTNGLASCWGSDAAGQSSPPETFFIDVTVGAAHSCGLRTDGAVECWGDPNATVPAAGPFEQIAAGDRHTCGVLESGALACWGADGAGQSTPPGGTYRYVTGGALHSCAVTSSGTVACWGANASGQVSPVGTVSVPGISAGGATTCSLASGGPAACFGDDSSGQATPPATDLTQLAVGDLHVCALDPNGALACWGSDTFGQATPPAGTFGAVTAGDRHGCALSGAGAATCWGSDAFGQASPPGDTMTAISGGATHSCGIRASNATVVCWGDDTSGQASPPAGVGFSQIDAGANHVCGVRGNGQLECWGANASGQASPPGASFSQVAVGLSHSCGLRPSGLAECWGSDVFGQSTPPPVAFVSIAAGFFHTCGVSTSGAVVCWGSDFSGESSPLGDSDSDGLPDVIDNCPAVANFAQADAESDGVGDACDVCTGTPDAAQLDVDGDGLGDLCDNCPGVPNVHLAAFDCNGDLDTLDPGEGAGEQCDVDANGIGDACELNAVVIRPTGGGPAGGPPPLGLGSGTTELDVRLRCGNAAIDELGVGILLPLAVDPNVTDFAGCSAPDPNDPFLVGSCGGAGSLGGSVDPNQAFTFGPGLQLAGVRPDTLYLSLHAPGSQTLCLPGEELSMGTLTLGLANPDDLPVFTTEGIAPLGLPLLTDPNAGELALEQGQFEQGPADPNVVLEIRPALGDTSGLRWEVTLLSDRELHRASFALVGFENAQLADMAFIGCADLVGGDPDNRRTCFEDPQNPLIGPFVDPNGSLTLGPSANLPRSDTVYVRLEGSLGGGVFLEPSLNAAGDETLLGVVEYEPNTPQALRVKPGLLLEVPAQLLGGESQFETAGLAALPLADIELIGAFQGGLDADGDGVSDEVDNCAFFGNTGQENSGGLNTLIPDLHGDACQCGELGDDGSVLAADIGQLRDALAGVTMPSPGTLARCSVFGGDGCDIVDWVVLARAASDPNLPLAPGVAQVCAPAVQPAPPPTE